MSAYIAELKQVTEDLNRLEVRWALVGALAYSVHGEPRTTKDIDVAIAVSNAEEPEKIADSLIEAGYSNKQLLMHTSPTHRLGFRVLVPTTKDYSIPLDLLYSSSGIESEIVEAAETIELLPALFLPVASLSHVLAMKIVSQNDADRLRDKADVQQLLLRATPEEIDKTREALELIAQRGFGLEKNLTEELEQAIAISRSS